MKIAVIGAGAMGSMLGAYLQAGGADVTLVVRRKELVDALASPGLTMKRYTEGAEDDGGGGSEAAPVPMKAVAGTDGLEVMDAVLLMVKGPDTKAAIESASAVIGPETKVVTLQNGVGNTDLIAETVPKENIYYGCLNMSAIMEAPGVLTAGLFGTTNIFLGSMVRGAAQQAFGEELCKLFRAGGVTAEFSGDIDREVWNKMLVNIAVNASCGLVRLRGGEAGEDQQFVLLAVDMVKEAIAVAEKCGVALDFGHFMTQVLPSARKTSGKHYPSMAQDMMITRSKTEIEFLNGAVERLGKAHGVPTPVNTTIARLVRTIEHNYDKQYMPAAGTAKSGGAFLVEIEEKFCKGCGFCVKYCPKGVLAIRKERSRKGYFPAKAVAPGECIGCLSCAAVCPEAAIRIRKEA